MTLVGLTSTPAALPGAATTAPGKRRERGVISMPRWAMILLAIGLQIGLTTAITAVRLLGLVEALAIVLGGIYAIGRRNLGVVTNLCCFLAGCEVMWRQLRAPVYYLMAPYAITALAVIATVFALGRINGRGRIALLYFALLLPGMITTIQTAGGDARELIAFSLSGPMALMALVLLWSQLSCSELEYRNALWALVLGGLGPLWVALTTIREELAASGAIAFKDASNFVASGGFGPVQVSSVLGLCSMVCMLLTLLETDRRIRVLAGLLAVVFSVQCLLTFSRGGMTATAMGIVALGLAHGANRRIRRMVVGTISISLVLGYFIVIPWLISFTNGAFEKRFTDTQSGRTELAANDYSIFLQHPLFGVGPGMTKYQRLGYGTCQLRTDKCKNESSSHTEFTRLLGEHGVIGIGAMAALASLAANAVLRSGRRHPFAVAFTIWAIAQMFYANLRVAAVPIAFALAFLTVRQPGAPPQEAAEPGDDAEVEEIARTARLGFGGLVGAGAGSVGPAPVSTIVATADANARKPGASGVNGVNGVMNPWSTNGSATGSLNGHGPIGGSNDTRDDGGPHGSGGTSGS